MATAPLRAARVTPSLEAAVRDRNPWLAGETYAVMLRCGLAMLAGYTVTPTLVAALREPADGLGLSVRPLPPPDSI